MLDLESIKQRKAAADAEIGALCEGKRWRMGIPARPDYDSDLLINAALGDIPALIAEVERLTQQRDAALAACDAVATDEAEDPCYYDHHGYCQAHGLQLKGECYMELARAALRGALVKEG